MFRILLVSVLASSLAMTAANAQNDEPSLVTKVYKIGDLVASRPSYAIEPNAWPTTAGKLQAPKEKDGDKTQGGMGGGFGGLGGGGGQGGGMMNVPDSIPKYISPQMGGMGGMGGMMMPEPSFSSDLLAKLGIDQTLYEELITVIKSVRNDQWEEYGGPYTLTTFRDQFIIRATDDVHNEISQLLKTLREQAAETTVEIEWLVTNVEVSNESTNEQVGTSALASGAVTCRDRQVVSTSMGTHKNYIMSAVPVVGESIAYMPTVEKFLSGWTVEIRPTFKELSDKQETATIDAVVTYSETPQEPELINHTPEVTIDRVSMEATQLAGTVNCKSGTWVQVAEMSQSVPSEAEKAKQSYKLYVRWTRSE